MQDTPDRVRGECSILGQDSMGTISIEELSPVKFLNLKITSRAESNMPKILPRKIHGRYGRITVC